MVWRIVRVITKRVTMSSAGFCYRNIFTLFRVLHSVLRWYNKQRTETAGVENIRNRSSPWNIAITFASREFHTLVRAHSTCVEPEICGRGLVRVLADTYLGTEYVHPFVAPPSSEISAVLIGQEHPNQPPPVRIVWKYYPLNTGMLDRDPHLNLDHSRVASSGSSQKVTDGLSWQIAASSLTQLFSVFHPQWRTDVCCALDFTNR